MTHFNFNFDGWDEVVAFARQVVGEEGNAVQPQGVHITPVLPMQPTPVPAQVPQSAPVSQPVTPAASVTQVAPAPQTAPAPQPEPAVPAPQAPVSAPAPSAAPQAATVPAPASAPVPSAVPTSTASYTLDDLARAAMPLLDAGRQADLLQLLQMFGVEALPALQPGQYGAFATKLREMGAQI